MSDFSQQTCHGKWIDSLGEKGLVSVIVPTYNRIDTLFDTLDCIFSQTYRPLELVVIDDGSTDGTSEKAKTWAKQVAHDKSFKFIYKLGKQKGAPVARNLGLLESSGQYINFLDSDDLIAPSKIEHQVNLLQNAEQGVAAYGPWRFFEDEINTNKIYQKNLIDENKDIIKTWIGGDFIPPHSMLWQRQDIYNMGPWDEQLAAEQDSDYALRLLLMGGKFSYCSDAWVYYRYHPNADESIGATNNIKTFQSRYRVLTQWEEQLTEKGQLDDYREVISMRYAMLAKRYGLVDKTLTNLCLSNSRRLSVNGKLPDIFTLTFLSKIIGETRKQKLIRNIRSILGKKRKNNPTMQMELLSEVKSTHLICQFDEKQPREK